MVTSIQYKDGKFLVKGFPAGVDAVITIKDVDGKVLDSVDTSIGYGKVHQLDYTLPTGATSFDIEDSDGATAEGTV